MFSRDRNEPDDPKYVHFLASPIIARAHAKLKVDSGSKIERDRIDAAKNAVSFCSKLEVLSSLLQTPSSIVDSDLKPAIERIQCKIAQLNKSSSAASSNSQQRGKKSSLKNGESSISISSLDEITLKRMTMSEMTKIPIKVLEKRLPGFAERLTRHLSPPKSLLGGDDIMIPEISGTCASAFFKRHSSVSSQLSPINHRNTQSPTPQNLMPCMELNAVTKNCESGCLATCAAAMMAIVFCSRIKNVHLPLCVRRSQAASSIQRAYMFHFYRNFHGSRKKRAAFFMLVKNLRKLIRIWRLRKKTRTIHFIKRFLVSVKLRAKFVRAVKQKFKLVRVLFTCAQPSDSFSFAPTPKQQHCLR
jgi:hypothetical protein